MDPMVTRGDFTFRGRPRKVRVKNKGRSMEAKFSIEDVEKEKRLGNGKRNKSGGRTDGRKLVCQPVRHNPREDGL